MKIRHVLLFSVTSLLLAGCASGRERRDRDHERGPWARGSSSSRVYGERDREVRRGRPPVPSSAMPAPGACRIWDPDVRADAQRVPLGAWLLHRPQDRPGVLEIAQYSDSRRGVVKHVVVYELDRRARQWDPRDDDPGWGRRSGTGGATGDSPFDDDDGPPDRDGRGDVVPPR